MTAYPVANKRKSFDICLAWVRGCGGQIGTLLRDGPAFFYGVDQSNVGVWKEVVRSGRDYWYCDNSYFDARRGVSFRVTKNRLQHSGIGKSDGMRFGALGLRLDPWRCSGGHIVVCPQSESFMRDVVGEQRSWVPDVLRDLGALTRRPLRVRPWNRDKAVASKTLSEDLVNAHALVTWSSAAAVTAVMAGVPVVTLGQSAAEPMSGSLQKIELLPTPDRASWVSVLADNEFTLAEMRDGTAWRRLNA